MDGPRRPRRGPPNPHRTDHPGRRDPMTLDDVHAALRKAPNSLRFRVGRRRPRNLYAHTADNVDGLDIGRMDSAELAALVCEAVNAQLDQPSLLLPPPPMTDDEAARWLEGLTRAKRDAAARASQAPADAQRPTEGTGGGRDAHSAAAGRTEAHVRYAVEQN